MNLKGISIPMLLFTIPDSCHMEGYTFYSLSAYDVIMISVGEMWDMLLAELRYSWRLIR